MSAINKFQDWYDNLAEEDFHSNYYKELTEKVTCPFEAIKNLKTALFVDGAKIDESKLWESLSHLADQVGDDEMESPCPYESSSVISKREVEKEIKRLEAKYQDLIKRVEKQLIPIKVALYGQEAIEAFEVNAAVKNLEYIAYGRPIETKTLTVVRK